MTAGLVAFVLSGLVLMLFIQMLGSLRQYNPVRNGGDRKKISLGDSGTLVQAINLERPIGLYGTRFVASMQVEGNTAVLVKGQVQGSTGSSFTLGGHSVGFGISNFEFWTEKHSQSNEDGDELVLRVFVNFRRIVLFIFNEQLTWIVGELVLVLPRQVSPKTEEATDSRETDALITDTQEAARAVEPNKEYDLRDGQPAASSGQPATPSAR